MKKKLIIFLLISSYSNSQDLTSSQEGSYFVQGISVKNIITLNNITADVDAVLFYALNLNNDTIVKFQDQDATNGFSWDLDMGKLEPNVLLYAQMYIGNIKEGAPIDNSQVTIIAKPKWLANGGSISNIEINGSTISFEGKYPIYDYSHTFDKNVKLLGKKSVSMEGNFIFNTSFDLQSGISKVENNKAEILINVLNYGNIVENINYDANLTMDNDLNITFYAAKEIKKSLLNWDSPSAKFPIFGVFGVEVNVNISFYATLKGQIVIGQKEGLFGLIEDDQGRKTKIIGVLTGIGTIKGGLTVFGGVAKATGSLIAKAKIGLGFDYVNIPQKNSNLLLGGDLEVSGRVEINLFDFRLIKKLFGYNGKNIYNDSTQIYYTYFGDTNTVKSLHKPKFDNIFNSQSFTVKDSGTMLIPELKPQPTFSANKDKLYAVWIEIENDNYQILMSKFDMIQNQFLKPNIIASNNFSKSNPKIGLLKDGSAIITWTQLRYNESNISQEITINDLIKAQDIWFAFYDAEKDSVIQVQQFKDQESSLTDGRAEGQASISIGSNNEAMVTWVSLNESVSTSDIWFSNFSKEDNEWLMTEPNKLIDIPGTNSDVNVIYGDSSVAIAVWINDPDGDLETKDNEIIYAGWDGNNWDSNTKVIAKNDGNINYNHLSLASNNQKIALAYTSVLYDTININKINLEVYDLVNESWDQNASFQDTSNWLTYQNPQTSISSEGFVSVAYQVINKYSTVDNIDNGELYLYVKDLNTNTPWKEITSNSDLCDTNTFIWDMTTGFGNDNSYYVMTQEYNDNGIVTNPKNGVLFGNPELSMVLRGLKINDDLTLSDIEEPDTKTTYVQSIDVPVFRFINNYPNPFERFTSIEFSIYQTSNVTLEIFNSIGTKVATLIDSNLNQGIYTTNFDAGDLPEGIYHSRLTVNGQSSNGKLVLIK